jgi:hypothetical protein
MGVDQGVTTTIGWSPDQAMPSRAAPKVEDQVDTSRGDCASSANRVSPATFGEHEGTTL